ncbi:MAG: hypothetical protein K8W52_44950 [Deltaproteobacteria bacterium]|nr:hypothetical protein [Deltaproteobacteria bacterium]
MVHATAHREGTEVVVDLGGLLDVPAALQGLVELAKGAAPAEPATAP